VLIEADSQIFEKLLINRPNTHKYNVALYHKNEMIEFMQISGYAQMLSGIVSEYDKRHLERIKREVRDNGGECRIVSMQGARFDSIMADLGVSVIDYLSIDVEGGEMKILESIDFSAFEITLIGIENNYGDSSIADLLSRYGYKKIVNLGCDEFYARYAKGR